MVRHQTVGKDVYLKDGVFSYALPDSLLCKRGKRRELRISHRETGKPVVCEGIHRVGAPVFRKHRTALYPAIIHMIDFSIGKNDVAIGSHQGRLA